MSISVQCPGCGKKLKAKDELVSKRVKCPGCGQAFLVSAAPVSASSPSHGASVAGNKPDTEPRVPALSGALPDTRQRATPSPRLPKIERPNGRSTDATPVPLQTSDRPKSSPAGQGGMPLGWLLGLSMIAGLFFGAVGFGLGSVGFERETERVTHYSKFGERTGETGHGTLRFYGITLLKSDDISSFGTSSNLIAVLIAAVMTGVGAVCGGGCVFVAIRRLTRRGHVVRGGDVTESSGA